MNTEIKDILAEFPLNAMWWIIRQIEQLQEMIDENKDYEDSRCTFVFYVNDNIISHPRSRIIGENLNELVGGGEAGLELMRLVFYSLDFSNGDAAQLDKCWDGIGLWLN